VREEKRKGAVFRFEKYRERVKGRRAGSQGKVLISEDLVGTRDWGEVPGKFPKTFYRIRGKKRRGETLKEC